MYIMYLETFLHDPDDAMMMMALAIVWVGWKHMYEKLSSLSASKKSFFRYRRGRISESHDEGEDSRNYRSFAISSNGIDIRPLSLSGAMIGKRDDVSLRDLQIFSFFM